MRAEAARTEVQEFKNAFHMFRGAAREEGRPTLQFSPQRVVRREGETGPSLSLFGPSPLTRHFRQSSLSGGRTQSQQGLGVTIDDSGNFLLAEWSNSQIEGRYFLFKPAMSEEGERGQHSALCMYGCMRAGSLAGDSYAYNITGSLSKANFENNRIVGKCFVVHSNKLFVAGEAPQTEKVDCEVVTNEVQPEDETKATSNVLKVPKISVFLNKQMKGGSQPPRFPSNFQQVDANTFVTPNKFIEDLISSYQKEGDKSGESLVYARLNERDIFVGFLQGDKKQQRQGSSDGSEGLSRINGFGMMLKNEWPASYGFYKEGKLDGLGRLYESEMSLLDGFFVGGELMEGFVVDYFSGTTSFGHQSSIDPEFRDSQRESCFIVTNSFETVSSEYVGEYRKSFHLKSLSFNNSYFNAPKLLHRSPWPYPILNRLTKRSQIDSIIRSFRPLRDVEISEIQKVGHSSENRVEKMLIQEIRESNNPSVREDSLLERQELLRQKSNFIRKEIEKNLKEKEFRNEESVRDRRVENYVDEYNRIERRKTEIVLNEERRSRPKRRPDQEKEKEKEKEEAKEPREGERRKEQRVNRSVSEDRQPPPTPRRITSTYEHNEHNEPQASQSPAVPAPLTPQRLAITPVKLKPAEGEEHELTQLVQEYEQCETQRKNSISGGGTTRRTNGDPRTTPRPLASKRELMQQDQRHFKGREKAVAGGKQVDVRRKVDLDLIYRQFLHK